MYDKDERVSRETKAGFMLLRKANPASCSWLWDIEHQSLPLLASETQVYRQDCELLEGRDGTYSPHYPQYCGKR